MIEITTVNGFEVIDVIVNERGDIMHVTDSEGNSISAESLNPETLGWIAEIHKGKIKELDLFNAFSQGCDPSEIGDDESIYFDM